MHEYWNVIAICWEGEVEKIQFRNIHELDYIPHKHFIVLTLKCKVGDLLEIKCIDIYSILNNSCKEREGVQVHNIYNFEVDNFELLAYLLELRQLGFCHFE